MSMFQGGGFSGSQIGGGFVSNDSGNQYGQSGGASQKRVIPYDQRKLSQVTIKQIMSAPPVQADDPVMVDGMEIGQLHLIARLMSIDQQSSHTQYRISDYTGTLEAKQWSNDAQDAQSANLQVGSWVHIFGRINSFQGKCSVNVFDVVPVTNFNEITHHFTEVIFAHLTNLETAKKQEMQMNNSSMMMGGNNNSNTMSSMGPGYGNDQGMGGNQGGGWNGNAMNKDSGRSSIEQKVLSVVKSPEFANSETGCNVQAIFDRLPNEDIQKLKDTIDLLAEEGVMYSTLDDEHYKAVE